MRTEGRQKRESRKKNNEIFAEKKKRQRKWNRHEKSKPKAKVKEKKEKKRPEGGVDIEGRQNGGRAEEKGYEKILHRPGANAKRSRSLSSKHLLSGRKGYEDGQQCHLAACYRGGQNIC